MRVWSQLQTNRLQSPTLKSKQRLLKPRRPLSQKHLNLPLSRLMNLQPLMKSKSPAPKLRLTQLR